VKKLKIHDLIKLYEDKRKIYGAQAYKHISDIFKEAKKIHYEGWLKSPTPRQNHEQSWRAFKGKNFEKLILYIIRKEIEDLGLKIVEGTTLEKTQSMNLPLELNKVKRNLLIDYGDFGAHLPDVDLIIYEPETCKVVAVISSKITLRERIAQTGYWKVKLQSDSVTQHIKVFFITPDEDGDLVRMRPAKKGRAIVEVDTDGAYVMSQRDIEQTEKVKKFEQFIDDIKKLIERDRA
jgi:type II restriction enzyme